MGHNKRRKNSGPRFAQLYHWIIQSEEFGKLSPKAVKLFIEVISQYNGTNNGDLSVTWSQMRKRGWRSSGTLFAARDELEKAGWLERTRQGGRNKCNLYAVTIYRRDECQGKLDVGPTNKPSHAWKQKLIRLAA